MKNKTKLTSIASILLLGFTVLITSCKKDKTIDVTGIKGKESTNMPKFHKLLVNNLNIVIREDSGQYFFADDIILTAEQFAIMKKMANNQTGTTERSAITKELFRRWTGGTVYYTLNLSTDNNQALTAMRNIAAVAPITFVQRSGQRNYIDFVKSSGNSSALGMVGGKQTLNLYNSNNVGIIMHEILHALGVNHEQCRPDRESSIRIIYANIPADKQHNFNPDPTYKGVGAFDFGSIMMYGPYSFSSNGQPTITRLDGSVYTTQVANLSQRDIAGLNDLY